MHPTGRRPYNTGLVIFEFETEKSDGRTSSTKGKDAERRQVT